MGAGISLGLVDMNKNVRVVEFKMVEETPQAHLDIDGIQLVE